jgi:xanthine dehydrogenase molybdopterin-binding subunit B
LKKLVPDSGNLVIEVPTQDIKDKLAGKGISKVEIATTQTTTPATSATADSSGALDEGDGDEGE